MVVIRYAVVASGDGRVCTQALIYFRPTPHPALTPLFKQIAIIVSLELLWILGRCR
jgi:hypothetical protein